VVQTGALRKACLKCRGILTRACGRRRRRGEPVIKKPRMPSSAPTTTRVCQAVLLQGVCERGERRRCMSAGSGRAHRCLAGLPFGASCLPSRKVTRMPLNRSRPVINPFPIPRHTRGWHAFRGFESACSTVVMPTHGQPAIQPSIHPSIQPGGPSKDPRTQPSYPSRGGPERPTHKTRPCRWFGQISWSHG
jgi:hypothetical protein